MRTLTMRTLSSLHPPTRRVASLLVAGLLLVLAGSALAGSYTEDFTTTTYRDPATTADWDTTAGELRLPPFGLGSVANLPSVTPLERIDVQGNLLFAACRLSGFYIVDITYPESPLSLAFLGGWANDVEVHGDLAYLSSYAAGLRVIDVSDPLNPVQIGGVGTPDQAFGVTVDGQTAYVASRVAGLQVIDVSDPTTPTIQGSLVTPGAYRVAVANNVAYVGDASGLIVVDVSDPANPDSIGAYPLPSTVVDLVLDGTLLHLAALASDLVTLDVSDPTNPTLLGSLALPGHSQGLELSGSRLYVGCYANGVSEVDVSDPTNPQLVDTLGFTSFTYGVVSAGEYLYAANLANGLQVLRRNHAITTPGDLGSFGMATPPNEIDISAGVAVISTDSGIEFHSVSPSGGILPGALGTYAQPARKTDIQGSLAFVASLGLGLHVVDIADVTTPAAVGSLGTGSFAVDVDVDGNLAFVADFDSGLVVVDVSNPSNPSLVGSLDTPGHPLQVVVQGTVAWVAEGTDGVQVIDVSNPSTPSLLANIPGNAYCLAIEGDRLYVGSDGGTLLRVYNVFNPATPASMGTVPGPGLATAMDIDGDRLFLTCSDPSVGYQVIDIQIGSTPQLLHTMSTLAAGDITLYGQWAYLSASTGPQYLRAFQDDWNIDANVGRSTELDAYDNEVIASVRLSTAPWFNQVSFEVSANGGVDWQPITSGSGWNDILIFGDDLRWRSTHVYNGTSVPVSEITLEWLYPFGDITRIVDVPNDQGGRVYVEFQRASIDNSSAGVSAITQYSVYREVTDPLPVTSGPVLASAAAVPEGIIVPEGVGSRWIDGDLYVEGPEVTPLGTGFPAGTWVLVASVPALQIEKYLVEVTTDADSSDTGTNDDTFFVIAHTTNPSSYFRSPPVTGHSVDNIAPGVPQNLAATYDQGEILLSWSAAPEADFQYHRIYRSTDPGFVPGPGTLVHETAATSWADTPPNPNSATYKVTTLDHAGNESAPASLGSVTAVGGGNGAPVFALRGAMPNPLRADTSIAFELPADSPVSLEVYDVTGRRIRTLAAESMVSGKHEIAWDGTDESGSRVAAGVYLYRLRAGDFQATRRMVVIR